MSSAAGVPTRDAPDGDIPVQDVPPARAAGKAQVPSAEPSDLDVRRRRGYAAGALTVGLVAVLAALHSTGAAAPAPLLDPGAVVRWGLPLVTVGVHAAAGLTVGAFACAAVVLRPSKDAAAPWSRAVQIGTLGAIAWTLLQTVRLILGHATMFGEPLSPASTGPLVEFIANTEAGGTMAWSVVLTSLVAVLAVLVTSTTGAAWTGAVAVLALAPLAAGGHASSDGNHVLAVSAMWLHLVGMAIWVGGLVVLLLTGGRRRLRSEVGRYSTIAGWGFAIVFASGLINAVLRLNTPAELITTGWGQLLVVKTVLFAGLGLGGYGHRQYVLRNWEVGASGGYRRGLFWRLAGVETLIMGAIVGVSVALGSSDPPAPQRQASDEYTELTGAPAPPELSPASIITEWRVEPVLLLAAVAGALVYVRWVLRLYQRGDDWPVRRTVCWLLGMVLFAWTTSGGLEVYASVQFSVHMAQHMLLMMFLPILYVVGAPLTLAYRALPARRDGSTGPRELLLALTRSPVARFLGHPVTAALNVVISMGLFYLTPLFEITLDSHVAHLVMVAHFSLAGYLFINILIGIDPGPRRPFYPLRLVLLLPSMVFHTFFGLGLVSGSTLLAAPYYARLQWVGDPLADQQIGGALAWATGELPVLGLAVIIALKWVQADGAREDRERRRAAQATQDEVLYPDERPAAERPRPREFRRRPPPAEPVGRSASERR